MCLNRSLNRFAYRYYVRNEIIRGQRKGGKSQRKSRNEVEAVWESDANRGTRKEGDSNGSTREKEERKA